MVLEQRPTEDKGDFKSQIIALLVKAVVIGSVAIASLAGAGGIVKNIMVG